FDWVRRMGVHEAYHRSRKNRIIHWLCIPLELLVVVKLLSMVGEWVALLAIVGVGLLYLAADLVGGALMIAILVGLFELAKSVTPGSALVDAAAMAALFVASFSFQTRVGHGVFEGGVDDTEKNLAEFKRTWNPVPLVLIFYYHL